ncbi:MAG: VCBS repeat-containing protein, partial [Saprospiraceae bacterium]|nr:VCBS repeat-containing protein [Saprospiraceae bacterium]
MMKNNVYPVLIFIGCLWFIGCQTRMTPSVEKPIFTKIPAAQTGINFVNTVKNSPDFNIFSYRNFYNGGGVSIGDVNNDGLQDLFFTANMGSNKLYLNKGNFTFEDITEKQ